MHSTEDALAKVSFFAPLSRKNLRKLARLCTEREFPADALILREGSTGLGLFLITAGRVEVFKTEEERRITLAVLGSGDLLGEMALVDDQPRSASAVTLEPTSCLLLTRDSFRTLVRKDPEIAWAIVPNLVERLRDLQSRLLAADALAGEPVAEAAPAAPAAEETAEPDEEPRRRTRDFGLGLLRAGYGLLMSATRGLAASVGVVDSSLRSLADDTDLATSEELEEVLRAVPRGTLSAGRSGWTESSKIPERMIESFFFHSKNRQGSTD